jgi:hypothetical protein
MKKTRVKKSSDTVPLNDIMQGSRGCYGSLGFSDAPLAERRACFLSNLSEMKRGTPD